MTVQRPSTRPTRNNRSTIQPKTHLLRTLHPIVSSSESAAAAKQGEGSTNAKEAATCILGRKGPVLSKLDFALLGSIIKTFWSAALVPTAFRGWARAGRRG